MPTLFGKEKKKELFWKTSMVPLLDSLNCVFRDERNSNNQAVCVCTVRACPVTETAASKGWEPDRF